MSKRKWLNEWYAKEIENYEKNHVKNEDGVWVEKIPDVREDLFEIKNKENDLNEKL